MLIGPYIAIDTSTNHLVGLVRNVQDKEKNDDIKGIPMSLIGSI